MTSARTSENFASLAARERYIPRGLANTHAIFIARAEGVRVWDVHGAEYLDFTSGIGVVNTGHRHPHVVRAVHEQLDRLTHTCFQVAMYEPYVELAARRVGAQLLREPEELIGGVAHRADHHHQLPAFVTARLHPRGDLAEFLGASDR